MCAEIKRATNGPPVRKELTVFVDSASKNENATSKKSEPHMPKKKNKNLF